MWTLWLLMTLVSSVLCDKLSTADLKAQFTDCRNKKQSILYCETELLKCVQLLKIFNDSKHFVDMFLKKPPEEIERVFIDFYQTDFNASLLEDFVNEYFYQPGYELQQWKPPDFSENIKLFDKLKNSHVRQFAKNVHSLWSHLGKQFKKEVDFTDPFRYSSERVPYPFIVPGGRFREFYYWDTYWVIRGLLVSEMAGTARHMVLNLAHFIQKYGHVPNGGRTYYLNRSQPPLLSEMVRHYYDKTGDKALVIEMLPLLAREIRNFIKIHVVENNVTCNGKSFNGAVTYNAQWERPRPESYDKDFEIVENLEVGRRRQVYKDLSSAAESGWDFSTRWFGALPTSVIKEAAFSLNLTRTSSIIPVDLLAILHGAAENMEFFYQVAERTSEGEWGKLKEKMEELLVDCLFTKDEDDSNVETWFDYDIELEKHSRRFYASMVAPIVFSRALKSHPNFQEMLSSVFVYAKKQGVFDFEGGLPSSLVRGSGQQWDFPNGWAPFIDMWVTASNESSDKEIRETGRSLARKWVTVNMKNYLSQGAMFEKYNVENESAGDGGEYEVETGFGWTNGLVLSLLERYGDDAVEKSFLSTLSNSSASLAVTDEVFLVIVCVFYLELVLKTTIIG